MKRKILAIAIVAMMAMAFLVPTAGADGEVWSIFDVAPNAWEIEDAGVAGNEGTINVTSAGGVYRFENPTDQGWPHAITQFGDDNVILLEQSDWGDLALHYDITVERNASITLLYYGTVGFNITSVLIARHDADYDEGGGDIAAGTYSGSITLEDLFGTATDFGSEADPQPAFTADPFPFQGVRVFAVGGDVSIRELRIAPGTTTTDPPAENDNDNDNDNDNGNGSGTGNGTGGGGGGGTNNNRGNPATADAGIAMFVVTGLAGLAGAGVLIGKKRK